MSLDYSVHQLGNLFLYPHAQDNYCASCLLATSRNREHHPAKILPSGVDQACLERLTACMDELRIDQHQLKVPELKVCAGHAWVAHRPGAQK
jgi:hypothetical protein